MNRSALLLVLLGVSVAGNALLGYWVVRRAPPPAADTSLASSSVAKSASSVAATGPSSGALAAAELTSKLAAPRTAENLREIAAQLRASGFPNAVVRMVMQSLVDEELMRRQSEIFDWTALPYWQEQRPTPEQMKAMRGFQKERRALMADLNLPLSPREEAVRRRQFGNLPDAKIAALEKIQQDYNELRQEMFESQRNGGPGGRDLAAQQRLLQEEQERDVAALLSPEEKIEYELRNSSAANQVRSQLRGIEVNEQEFRDLFAAQKTYEAANPRQPGAAPTLEQREAGLAAWDTYQAAARGALGEERYRQFLLSSQLDNSNAKNFFTARPGITTEQIQAVARLSRSTGIELGKEISAPGLSGEERRARLDALAARAQAQAAQILGPQLAKEAEAARIWPGPRIGNSSGPAIRLPGGG
jgi:hypothetical protein